MVRGTKSIVWYFFKKSMDSRHGICRICHQPMKYFGGTSNFRQHLIRKHRTQFNIRLKEIGEQEQSDNSEQIAYRMKNDAETGTKFGKSDKEFSENIHGIETQEIFINNEPDGKTGEAIILNSTCQSPTPFSTNHIARDQQRVLPKEKSLNRKADQVYKSAEFNCSIEARNTLQNKLSLEECEAFGKIIATHLRQLPISGALECQSDILHHLVQKRLGRTSTESRIQSYSTENGTEEIIVQAWENIN